MHDYNKWIKWAPRIITDSTLSNKEDSWDYLEFPIDETEEDMRTYIYTFHVNSKMMEDPYFHGIDIVEIDHPPEEWFDMQILHFNKELIKTQTKLNHYEDWILTLALEQSSEEQNAQ